MQKIDPVVFAPEYAVSLTSAQISLLHSLVVKLEAELPLTEAVPSMLEDLVDRMSEAYDHAVEREGVYYVAEPRTVSGRTGSLIADQHAIANQLIA
jgi:hypothetical protein